ncbi:aldo/keto reductase [Priestia taiwanensis]|uniref:Oxidoreductase n=1 Tax=Priestia taiwanensis TaxID=1347902 RepID=A0A917AJF3_9BACI|nr:aldo/keto reductase [Priestia taiwanensis]MBM7361845.1 putative oxidoreductase [Priestia taiwanensis]GGE57370.1 oxidoreductase [Priestia taiwanensis]
MNNVNITEELSFSRIIQGFWRLADWKMTNAELVTFMEQCIEVGVTTFDHADIYGDYTCERIFGEALSLKPSLRDEIQIVTKCGIKLPSVNYPDRKVIHYDSSKPHIIESAEQSLRNLQTDYIDVLLLHRPDYLMDPEEIAEAFSVLKKDGKVRSFGVSNFTPSQVAMLQSYVDAPLVTNQIELSAMRTDNMENGTLDFMMQHRMAPMIWSPLAGGRIFHEQTEQAIRLRTTLERIGAEIGAQSLDQLMYAWLLRHPANLMPICGTGKMERVKSAVDALKLHMSQEQWYDVLESSKGYHVP